jgi:excisionase family DNA binding protein
MSGIFQGSSLLKAQDVADVLKIKEKTLMRWVYEKKIPFIRFGSGQRSIVRFSPLKLNDWLESFSHAPDETHEGKFSPTRKPKQASKKTIDDFNQFAGETYMVAGFEKSLEFFFDFFVEKI